MSDSAENLEFIESPCIGICRLDATGVCVGCFRTRDEIAGWLAYPADRRREIIEELPGRAESRFDP
ncbi:MAG: DUF1289 domain-containing protein [Wenzhouxiangellaceae bacterium]|nr:DUF1289 domain-containing protein [Wenzhouxiangellaceae bacterium]